MHKMIKKFGVGVDVVEISRFEKMKFSKKASFYKKLFFPTEIQYCLKYKNPYPHFAGKFAIKEAVKKAINEQISFLDIETSYSNSKPIIILKNKKCSNYNFAVSLSHEKKLAIAIVMSEKIN